MKRIYRPSDRLRKILTVLISIGSGDLERMQAMAVTSKIIEVNKVKPIITGGGTYESRMILDDTVAGENTVQLNHCTVKAGAALDGGAHEKTELYYVLAGKMKLRLDDEFHNLRPGNLIIIPGGCFHAVENASEDEDVTFLTIWLNAEDNEMYKYRLEQWGKSFKTIDED